MKKDRVQASAMPEQPAQKPGHGFGGLLQRANRGMLLDLSVFGLNIFLMRFLISRFAAILKDASEGDFVSQLIILAMLVGMLILPPIGAMLKRWHFHARQHNEGEELSFGCFFNPIFYFCVVMIIFIVIQTFLFQYFYGDGDPGPGVFVTSMFAGIGLMILHTYLVYRYFSPPKNPQPKFAFLLDPRSDLIGDICIWVNVLFFQMFWNYAFRRSFVRPANAEELIGRIFVFGFIALLVYFPPRIFYLAEDIGRRKVWLTILLANSPILFRVLIGISPDGGW